MNFVKERIFVPCGVRRLCGAALDSSPKAPNARLLTTSLQLHRRAGPLMSKISQTDTNNIGKSSGADKPSRRVVAAV
jgi:hypothetical protein